MDCTSCTCSYAQQFLVRFIGGSVLLSPRLLAARQRGSFRTSSVRAEFEVVNLPLNQLPFGLKLLLPHRSLLRP